MLEFITYDKWYKVKIDVCFFVRERCVTFDDDIFLNLQRKMFDVFYFVMLISGMKLHVCDLLNYCLSFMCDIFMI